MRVMLQEAPNQVHDSALREAVLDENAMLWFCTFSHARLGE
jgi:hypothetical protein